jgi:cytosine/adenosine deaminase-related metal-dependent hydrolase
MTNELSEELQAQAKWCADLMRADGITAEHVASMTDDQQTELAMAYMQAIGKKIQQIQNIYLTRVGAKPALQNFVLTSLQ